MSEASRADNWEDHWGRFATSASLNPAQSLRHKAVLQALQEIGRPVERLIDIGSGQGDFLARATKAAAAREYAGFELSAKGVAISSEKVPQASFLQVDLFAPTIEALAYDGWATAAVCSDVIEHVDAPVDFLRALKRYLAEGAHLIITVPGGPMSKFDQYIGHRRHFDEQSIRQVLTEAGFRVERVRLAGFPFFNLYRLLVILRGERLVQDVGSSEEGQLSAGARLAMRIFGFLFRFNLRNSPVGWQVVALARRQG